MKKMKHLFTMLLMLCVAVASAHDFEVDGVYYKITDSENRTVAVSYKGDYSWSYSNEYLGGVVIPESVVYNDVDYAVTSILENAFESCSGLTSVEIPSTIVSIGDYAFSRCTGLEVHISDLTAWLNLDFNNQVFTDYSLYLNGDLMTEIVIPESVTEIKKYMFSGCTSLERIEIPASVSSIGSRAFYGCSSLVEIEIPSSVRIIEDYLFSNCTALANVIIGDSVTSIGERAFENCDALVNIEIPASVTTIKSNAFANCDILESFEIPDNVVSIENYLFYRCSALASITIGKGVSTKS